ncbi:hypothetical protein FACS1894184_17800 [Clostridia bacterium]|nr:hypothetical protein FACS1894184_17800 [Clostridia bacterium]
MNTNEPLAGTGFGMRNKFVEQLFILHHDRLLKFCMRRIASNNYMRFFIEDCVQETFLAALERYETLKEHSNVAGWLSTTVTNRIYNNRYNYTRNMGDPFSSPDCPPEYTDNPIDEWHAHTEKQSVIMSLYNGLSSNHKRLFRDFFIEGASTQTLAKRYHIAPSSIRSQIYRMRHKLWELYYSS